ncbi:hypothetical protein D9758_004988 [Tetrapyrgos nigripes]|uniref:HIT domain-containing protein n=1 Tax=Tetrapyrgos nigripes TaxID=182062 RepID=A0A8H5GVZ2_9AGAR|nr:hypothetical protein D9758_004988 [Tetrapyrgos nigripes]
MMNLKVVHHRPSTLAVASSVPHPCAFDTQPAPRNGYQVRLYLSFTPKGSTIEGQLGLSPHASSVKSSKVKYRATSLSRPSFLPDHADRFSFMDIGPLSKGHALIIPKYHAAKMHELPDEYLADAMPIAKKIALAQGAENYNILQNNGRLAHQLVDHVHFHVIPKPNEEEGLGVGWPSQTPSKEELQKTCDDLKGKL